MPHVPTTQPERVRVLLLVFIGALPWTWFLLRDHLGELGDLISLGLPLLAVPCIGLIALGAIWVQWRVVIALMVSWTLVFAIGVLGPRLPTRMDPPVHPITFVSANVRYDNPTPALAAEDVLAQDADVVVVPEATQALVRELAPQYPYTHETQETAAYGVAVFSRYPLHDGERLYIGNGVLRIEVDAPTPFVLYATHLSRPVLAPGDSSYVSHGENYEQVADLDAHVGRESLPVVIAGDLNLSDRVRGYRLLDDHLTDVTRDGWGATTYVGGVYRFFMLRIDHIFASDGWCGDRVDDFVVSGSDHRALRVDLGECG